MRPYGMILEKTPRKRNGKRYARGPEDKGAVRQAARLEIDPTERPVEVPDFKMPALPFFSCPDDCARTCLHGFCQRFA